MPTKTKTKGNNEPTVGDGVEIILALSAQLEKLGLVKWEKVDLGNGSVGYALFFPLSIWELNKDKLILKKKKSS